LARPFSFGREIIRKNKAVRAWVKLQLALLKWLGTALDKRPFGMRGQSVRDWLIATCLRIRDKQGSLVPLTPNRAQAEFAARCTRRNVILKARQVGMTTYVAARFFVHTITHPGTVTVQVAHDRESAEEIFRIVHRFLDNLPLRLRAGALVTSRANVRQLVFPLLDSEYRVETAADPHAGRGLTIHNLHCSEVASWPGDAAATLASLRAAVAPEGEIVLESTPKGAGGCFYDEWQRAAETGYTRHFFAWWWEPGYVRPNVRVRPLSDEESELAQRCKLSDAQIAFRREVRANFRRLARQEFAENPASCFLASGECFFELDAIARRLDECGEPVGVRDNGRLQVWWPAAPVRQYIIGVDPAGGGSEGDYACAQVIEHDSGLQCAELHGHFTPRELALRIAELGREYNQALIAVERNNHGHAVLAHLQLMEYENIFEQNGQAGWLTTASTRPGMLEQFAAMLAGKAQLFSSRRLLAECRTFVRQANGTSSAAAGTHDDCVMAMALAQVVRAPGGRKNCLQVGRMELG
jgi:hypothetical protein